MFKSLNKGISTPLAITIIIVLVVVLIGGIFSYQYYWIPKFEMPKTEALETDWKTCSVDSDCIMVNGDCCGCGGGGTATTINKNFKEEWEDKLSKECQDITCISVISDDPSCSQEPKCINNICQLVEGEEDKTADWKIYKNEEYEFEVKYPLDFKEQKADSDATLLAITKTDRGSSYYFMIRVIKNYKINQIVSKVGEVKEINVGDHLGYEYFYIEGAGMSEVALIQVGEDALSISFDSIGSGQNFATPNDRKIYVQDFLNQILSTFKFIE